MCKNSRDIKTGGGSGGSKNNTGGDNIIFPRGWRGWRVKHNKLF